MAVIAKCPDCGSTDLVEWNVAYSLSRVTRWVVENGALVPADWEHQDAEWETDGEMGPVRVPQLRAEAGPRRALAVGEEEDDA